mmetsp:Transcript_136569/g.291694  ORF Transcript_136569/g.291694 Transcript_136569/m.291694 type:complete len:318 (-) Transcript_136569:1851-2804(-)
MPAKFVSINLFMSRRKSGKSRSLTSAEPWIASAGKDAPATYLICSLSSAMFLSPRGQIDLIIALRSRMARWSAFPECRKRSRNSATSRGLKPEFATAFISLSRLSCCSNSRSPSISRMKSRRSKVPLPSMSTSLIMAASWGLTAGSCAICGKISSMRVTNSFRPMSPLESVSNFWKRAFNSATCSDEKPPFSRKAFRARRLKCTAVRMKPSLLRKGVLSSSGASSDQGAHFASLWRSRRLTGGNTPLSFPQPRLMKPFMAARMLAHPVSASAALENAFLISSKSRPCNIRTNFWSSRTLSDPEPSMSTLATSCICTS